MIVCSCVMILADHCDLLHVAKLRCIWESGVWCHNSVSKGGMIFQQVIRCAHNGSFSSCIEILPQALVMLLWLSVHYRSKSVNST